MLFANCIRGTVQIVKSDSEESGGLYKIDGLPSGSGILIQGISVVDPGVIHKKHTIDDKKILYSFGAAFGDVGAEGLLLLGPIEGGSASMGSSLDELQEWFETNRVSASKTPVKFSAGGRGYMVFVTALIKGSGDPSMNEQGFEIRGVLAGPASK